MTTVAALVLTARYRPAGPSDRWIELGATPWDTGGSEVWLQVHTTVSAVLGMASFAAMLTLVWPGASSPMWRRPLPVVAALVSTVSSAVTIVTRDRLTWDFVVNTSDGAAVEGGYWLAALASDVRFVLVDGAQVAQAAYARTLVVHLVAPILAGATLVLAVRAATQPTRQGGSST